MNVSTRLAGLLLTLLSSNVLAQTFVLDPFFGTNGVATYEWSVNNGYQWDAVDAWVVRQPDGKWAVATQLRDGINQVAAVNWFEPDGQPTPPSPGAGPYTPFTRQVANLAGLVQSTDNSLSLGTSLTVSSTDVDFLIRRSFGDGSAGYTGCNGTFLQQVFFDLAPPSAIDDVLGGLAQDGFGRQVLVGTLESGAGETRIGVARILSQCGLDTSLNGTGKQVVDPNPFQIAPPLRRARANTVLHDSIGRILVGGGVTFGLNNTDDGACIVVRLLSTGQRDPGFGNNGVAYINSFTDVPGNIRCDVRGLAVQSDGRIIVNMDWTLTSLQGTSRREYNQRLTDQGFYDPSWLDPCCTIGITNAEVKAGGAALVEGDAVALIVFSSLTQQAGVDDSRGELVPLRLNDGAFASGFLPTGQRPLGLDSTSYHRIVVESPDRFLVVATSGPDILNHRRVHLLRYRRASTIPRPDALFSNGFE